MFKKEKKKKDKYQRFIYIPVYEKTFCGNS